MKEKIVSLYNYLKDNLNKISAIANILCLIDCIVIPIVTVLISVINAFSNGHNGGEQDSHNHNEWHEIIEKVALYVMTPLISMTTIYNFIQLRNVPLLLWTLFGLILFVLSHAHIKFTDTNVNSAFQKLHLPMALLGAVFLVSTNYASHELLKMNNLDHCCKHKHLSNSIKNNKSNYHRVEINMNDVMNNNEERKKERVEVYNIGYLNNNDNELASFL
ncbi:MerC domain-containing protein [Plasmodium brasilianum]|uniref:MerC domain-containing protein n=1 Tax=Plasmodium brasilianum TaxID=5824 RepID=A0ACB9YA44_PLABR|nr:MerC domain-containing protein [Plasmodium brasilianum]